jgi:hypothetical protein
MTTSHQLNRDKALKLLDVSKQIHEVFFDLDAPIVPSSIGYLNGDLVQWSIIEGVKPISLSESVSMLVKILKQTPRSPESIAALEKWAEQIQVALNHGGGAVVFSEN